MHESAGVAKLAALTMSPKSTRTQWTCSDTCVVDHTCIEKMAKLLGPIKKGYEQILTAEALDFLAVLHRNFNGTRLHLLQARSKRQAALNAGHMPTFLEVCFSHGCRVFLI